MNDLVFLKKDDVFTDSLVIAEQTDNQHTSVTRLIRKHKHVFESMGEIRFMDFKSKNPKGGRPSKVYMLNEQQATFLITMLDNNAKVVEFKADLVKEFYKMRTFIMERHSAEWVETRKYGKLTRKAETDTIQRLVEYAKDQGSEHADMLYMNYTRLANKMVGVTKRDEATAKQLYELSFAEDAILKIIDAGILQRKGYKEIYQDCKRNLGLIKQYACLEG